MHEFHGHHILIINAYPYEDKIKQADFRVKYRFLSPDAGGLQSGPPFQGIRCDFSIEGEGGNQQ